MKRIHAWATALALVGTIACGAAPSAFLVSDRRVLAPAAQGSTRADALESAPKPLALPETQERAGVKEARLQNGLRILVLERSGMPTESVALIVRRGSVDAKPGVAHLYTRTLLGADEREQLFYLGADQDHYASHDAVVFQAHALAPLTHSVVAAFAHGLKKPGFREGDLEDLKSEQRANLLEQLKSPTDVARTEVRKAVLGSASPYALRSVGESGETIDAIGKDDLATFHAGVTGPRATLAFAGPLGLEECLRIAQSSLSWLPASSVTQTLAATVAPTGSQIIVLDRPTASQSNIVIGFASVPEGDSRAVHLQVVSTLLARGLSGRLALKVRQEHGFSYGVRADNQSFRQTGIFTIESSVETAKTAESIASIATELQKLGAASPTADETMRAGAAAAGHSIQNQQTNELALSALIYLGMYNVSLADFEKRPSLRAITPELLQRATAQKLDMARAQIVVVGDAAKIEKSLRDLNLGPVKVVKLALGEAL